VPEVRDAAESYFSAIDIPGKAEEDSYHGECLPQSLDTAPTSMKRKPTLSSTLPAPQLAGDRSYETILA